MQGTQHFTRQSLAGLFRCETAPDRVEEIVAHALGCRECWSLIAQALADQYAVGPLCLEGPLRAVVDLYNMEQRRLEEGQAAQVAWLDIQSLGPKARRDKVRLTPSLHTKGFFDSLLAESRRTVAPEESAELAYLALIVARQLPDSRFSASMRSDLAAECCAEMANARRRAAKWTQAKELLARGFEYAKKGSGDPRLEGHLHCVSGALEADLGHRREAGEILRGAIELFEKARDWTLVGRTFVQLANVCVIADPQEGLRLAERALAVIQSRNQRLTFFAELVRVECLINLGAFREAQLRYQDLQYIFDQFSEPRLQLRRRFIGARLLEGFGHVKKAEKVLNQVIDGDMEHGLTKDFFLDLVYLYTVHVRESDLEGAIAVCRRALGELELMEERAFSDKDARAQMKVMWIGLMQRLREVGIEVDTSWVDLQEFVHAHWRTAAAEIPIFKTQ